MSVDTTRDTTNISNNTVNRQKYYQVVSN